MHADEPRPNWYLDPLVAAQKRTVHLEWIGRNVPAGCADSDRFEDGSV